MRQFLVLAGVVAGLAVPSSAAAQAEQVCPPANGQSTEYQAVLGRYLTTWWDSAGTHNANGGAGGAARRALGAQYTGFWADTARQGWSVAFAPGPLDASTARAAILAELAKDFTPEEIAFLDSKLHVFPEAYSEADLQAVADQVRALASEKGWDVGVGVGCFRTGFWRVDVTRYAVESTPEVIAETEALVAPFGDQVTLSYCNCLTVPGAALAETPPPAQTTPSAPAPTRPLDVRDYYSKRCRGAVLMLTAKHEAKLRLTAGRRHVAGKRVRLKLKQRSTRVKVAVTRADGLKFSQWVTFKRC